LTIQTSDVVLDDLEKTNEIWLDHFFLCMSVELLAWMPARTPPTIFFEFEYSFLNMSMRKSG